MYVFEIVQGSSHSGLLFLLESNDAEAPTSCVYSNSFVSVSEIVQQGSHSSLPYSHKSNEAGGMTF